MSWEKGKIASLGKIITGKTPPTADEENYGGEIPFITPSDMTGSRHILTERFITEKGKNTVKNCLLQKDAVCVSCIGSDMGKAIMTSEQSVTNQQINSIIVGDDFDARWVYYLMTSLSAKIKSLGKNATAVPILNKSKFSEIEICYPDLCSQKRIADILSAYDDLIENNQKQIKLLEEAAQRLYKEWFIDLRFPGHETTPIINGIPVGWTSTTIADVCQTLGGGTPSTKVPAYYENGTIKWVTPTDITKSSSLAILDTEKKITEEGLANSSAKLVPAGTILMTSRASIGFFGLFENEVCTNQGFINCIPNKPEFQMFLLYNLMNRVDEIRQKASGSTFLEISKSAFREFQILLPDDRTLRHFQDVAHRLYTKVRVHTKQIFALKQARDRLLPKLMNGEIEV